MEILVIVVGCLAFCAWFTAALSWVLALRHRAEGVSLGRLMVNGMMAFDPASFSEEGQVHQRRFLVAFSAFFVLVFLGAGLSLLVTT